MVRALGGKHRKHAKIDGCYRQRDGNSKNLERAEMTEKIRPSTEINIAFNGLIRGPKKEP